MIWALVNLVANICITPSSWLREVTPIRKKGPMKVSNLNNLRPVSYTCPLECIFDACWLWRNKQKLDIYLGAHQHGGRVDALVVSLSLIICLQLRTAAGLPTLLKKADLLQGFDLSWRSGCLVHLARAQIQGRDWLLVDSNFSQDKVRVRLLNLVGPIHKLVEFAIGQGKRTSVHLFGALTRGLADLYSTSPKVGMGWTKTEVERVWSPVATDVHVDMVRIWSLPQLVQLVNRMKTQDQVDHSINLFSMTERLLALEEAAPFQVNFYFFQFVDDAFSLDSSMFGLSSSCIADFLFTHFWRHKFASGAKGPVVLPVNWTRNEIDFSHIPDAQRPRLVDEVSVLGVLVDQNLSFEPLVAECCARFLKEAQGLISTCRDHSLGLLLQVDQIWNRVEPAALHAAVALASHAQGWPALSRRVNKVHYMVCKELLGCSGASLGVGGQSRVMHELGMRWRLGTRLAFRILVLRVRLLCLPVNLEAATPIWAALVTKGSTWLSHTQELAHLFGIENDFLETPGVAQLLRHGLDSDVKRAVHLWKTQILLPHFQRHEAKWFQEQSALWETTHSVRVAWDSHHLRLLRFLKTVMWSKPMWYHFRIWSFVRITGAFPSHCVSSTQSLVEELPRCPFCFLPRIGIEHVLACNRLPVNRPQRESWFDLDPAESFAERVRFVSTGLVAACKQAAKDCL